MSYEVKLGFSIKKSTRGYLPVPLIDGEFDFDALKKAMDRVKEKYPASIALSLSFKKSIQTFDEEIEILTYDNFWLRFKMDKPFNEIIDMVHDYMDQSPEERKPQPREEKSSSNKHLFTTVNGVQVGIINERVQITFPFKPDIATRKQIKQADFKYHMFSKRWYDVEKIPEGSVPDDEFLNGLKLILQEAKSE
jgi:hypothetical protein